MAAQFQSCEQFSRPYPSSLEEVMRPWQSNNLKIVFLSSSHLFISSSFYSIHRKHPSSGLISLVTSLLMHDAIMNMSRFRPFVSFVIFSTSLAHQPFGQQRPMKNMQPQRPHNSLRGSRLRQHHRRKCLFIKELLGPRRHLIGHASADD